MPKEREQDTKRSGLESEVLEVKEGQYFAERGDDLQRLRMMMPETMAVIEGLPPRASYLTPEMTVGIAGDLELTGHLALGAELDYYPKSNARHLLLEIGRVSDSIGDKGPKKFAQRIEDLRETMGQTAADFLLKDASFRTLQRCLERGDGDVSDEELAKELSDSFRAKTQARQNLMAEERQLDLRETKLVLAAESVESLKDQDATATSRLSEKAGEAGTLLAAVGGGASLIEYIAALETSIMDVEALGEMAINSRVTKLASSSLAALCSLPGMKPGLDVVFRTLLLLDFGDYQMAGLPGFERNICADPDGNLDSRVTQFKRALVTRAREEILKSGVTEDQTALAKLSVEIALAIHDGFLLSSFFDRKRDRHTLKAVLDKREDGKDIVGPGTLRGSVLPTDTEKVFMTNSKLTDEAGKGYPAPLTLVVRDMPDFLFTDLMHWMTVEVEGTKISLFEALREGKITLSEAFGTMKENTHTLALLKIFNAARAYKMVGEMPVEQIELLKELGPALKAVRGYTEWASKFFKALEKSLLPVYSDEEYGKAEITRIILVTTHAFLRRAIDRHLERGGDTENTEIDLAKISFGKVVNYARAHLVQNAGILTVEQFEVLEKWMAEKRELSDHSERIIQGDSGECLRKLLAGRAREKPRIARTFLLS